ncbi:hypothetical protein PspR84_23810 [Pseudomonas sp. R84]|nr:hypothetical protein PspR84_23810 [Pseudomonas sp. R84]
MLITLKPVDASSDHYGSLIVIAMGLQAVFGALVKRRGHPLSQVLLDNEFGFFAKQCKEW